MSLIKFEKDYIFRNNRSITSSSDIALTELVANAWDAGAMNVDITIPKNSGERIISICDDGCGMTDDEFKERWMTLNYNREKHQGNKVVFPKDIDVKKTRIAYGRNGIGRHGMLCFSNKYTVETWKDGEGNIYEISISSGGEPYKILSEKRTVKDGHGTIVSAKYERNCPNIEEIKDILSARFIYDPQFSLSINNEKIDLATCTDMIEEKSVTTKDGVELKIIIIDSTKTAKKSHQHGIAFWVSGRLVGSPSWTYNNKQILDARYREAKRYTFIVQTDDIVDQVFPDWTGFRDSNIMDNVLEVVKDVVFEFITKIKKEQVIETKESIITEKRDELEALSLSNKREISDFIDGLTENNPMILPENLSQSVDILMNIQKSNRGNELLTELSKMTSEELDDLTDLLKKWDINDVVSVMDEIDYRIAVIEAIDRVCDSDETDELHTLHPMVLQAKWLFGAEFDSPMFASNKALSTVVKQLFKDKDYDVEAIANPRKRPDIVCLKDYTFRAVCTEKPDGESDSVMKPDQILIIELKRGGSEINREEASQAEDYVHQIKKSGSLHKSAEIHAFVVGAKIGDISTHKESEDGIVNIVTYGHLVQTAKTKLFGLKEKLEEHYNKIGDKSIVEMALEKPKQSKLF